MDGGGDRQRSVHILLGQESRRRVPNHQRYPASARVVGQTHEPRTDHRSVPSQDSEPESSVLTINLDHLGEDSGFESGSNGN